MLEETLKAIGVAKFKKINRIGDAADIVNLYICPVDGWEIDLIWLRKIGTSETIMTGTLDQVKIHIDRLWRLKAFL
jgi:hypothetical protein